MAFFDFNVALGEMPIAPFLHGLESQSAAWEYGITPSYVYSTSYSPHLIPVVQRMTKHSHPVCVTVMTTSCSTTKSGSDEESNPTLRRDPLKIFRTNQGRTLWITSPPRPPPASIFAASVSSSHHLNHPAESSKRLLAFFHTHVTPISPLQVEVQKRSTPS
jgi:hypothetical protein